MAGSFNWMTPLLNSMMPGKPMQKPMWPTSPVSPVAPVEKKPLLGSLSSSYFKKPQAGLSAPPVAGPPQAGLADTGAASWAARYGVKPKWSKG